MFEAEKGLIEQSSFFSADWYLAEYPDVFASGLSAVQHFLRLGGVLGRDPSPGFSCSWYVSAYPDVAVLGLNPLVHFLRFGFFEGCSPVPARLVDEGGGVRGSVGLFNHKLWAGFSGVALRGLENLLVVADDTVRLKVLWVLARWFFVEGDYVKALVFLKCVLGVPGQVNERLLVALFKCYGLLGDGVGASGVLALPRAVERAGGVLPFLQVNVLAGGRVENRLFWLNELFMGSSLLSVALRDGYSELSLDALTWSCDEACLVHSGPLVSVVVPAFNAEATLAFVLRGLLESSWCNLEIIVVDDFSSDATVEVALGFVALDERVKLITNERNLGAYASRNAGVRVARGEFVTVHDSDDWSHPQKLELQVKALLEDDVGVASMSFWARVLPDLCFVGSWVLNERFVDANLSSLMVRRAVLGEVGLWDEVSVAADAEFLARLKRYFGEESVVSVLPEVPLSFSLVLEDSLTRTTASHVKTIHFGLRRLYHEAARCWHERVEKPVLREGDRPFPVPLGMLKGSARNFDCVFVADFALDSPFLAETLACLEAELALAKELVLLHWPDYRGWHAASIAPEVFELCLKHDVQFAHGGLELTAIKLLFFDAELWRYPIDSFPIVKGLKEARVVRGEIDESELITFFDKGVPRDVVPE